MGHSYNRDLQMLVFKFLNLSLKVLEGPLRSKKLPALP